MTAPERRALNWQRRLPPPHLHPRFLIVPSTFAEHPPSPSLARICPPAVLFSGPPSLLRRPTRPRPQPRKPPLASVELGLVAGLPAVPRLPRTVPLGRARAGGGPAAVVRGAGGSGDQRAATRRGRPHQVRREGLWPNAVEAKTEPCFSGARGYRLLVVAAADAPQVTVAHGFLLLAVDRRCPESREVVELDPKELSRPWTASRLHASSCASTHVGCTAPRCWTGGGWSSCAGRP